LHPTVGEGFVEICDGQANECNAPVDELDGVCTTDESGGGSAGARE